MKTILITGINGFLGSHLAKRLRGRFNVVGVARQVDQLDRLSGFDFHVVRSNIDEVEQLFNEIHIDFVIHTATSYGRNNEKITQIADSNLFMPFILLDMAVEKHVENFINTDTVLDRFVSAYALTKNQFKDWLYFRRNELKVINMQLEHFYGPGCGNSNFITNMIKKLEKNDPVINLTAGEQRRDFVYFEDVLDAFEIVIDKIDKIRSNSNFQVGSGENISVKDLAVLLKKQVGSKSVLNFGAVPYRENELMASEANIEPLRQLGWMPKYKIGEKLRIIDLLGGGRLIVVNRFCTGFRNEYADYEGINYALAA
jgi:nucleoside-diphosphate-sugar epimerase